MGNDHQHTIHILKQFVIPEAKYMPALLAEYLGTCCIGMCGVRQCVLTSIQFNRETQRFAREIEHISPNRMLSTKFDVLKPAITQLAP